MAEAIAVIAPSVMASSAAAYIPAFSTLATAASIGSAALTGVGAVASGEVQKGQADFQAAQLEQSAKEDMAVAGLKARRAKREKDLVSSRAAATAAGSGAGASDATVTNVLAGIEAQGEENQLMELYSGYSSSTKKYAEAVSRRSSGRASRTAGYIKGFGGAASGLSTAYYRRT